VASEFCNGAALTEYQEWRIGNKLIQNILKQAGEIGMSIITASTMSFGIYLNQSA
jgi:hypothetical protein